MIIMKEGIHVVDTQVRIVNQNGIDVAMNDNEIGEIIVKGKGIISNETFEKTKDGWVHTGDFGTMDHQGKVNVVKSNKDIVTDEDELSTVALEEILIKHPSVQEVSVIPEPDHLLGEVAHAFVVLISDNQTSETELINYTKEKLASDKKSIKLTFMDELPKTMSGKILKNQLG